MYVQLAPNNLPRLTIGAVTAGTTQTQAGATALTKAFNKVTTANASDGVALQRGDNPSSVGASVIVTNLHPTNALKVYAYYTSASTNDDGAAYGGTIDGGSANASVSQPGNTTFVYTLTAANVWVSQRLGGNGTPTATIGTATAGTTQTQAGATALTASRNKVTTGNASDGVALPSAATAADVGREVVITNLSANALKVYAFLSSSGTIDGGSANASITHAASTTRGYVCTGADIWVSYLT